VITEPIFAAESVGIRPEYKILWTCVSGACPLIGAAFVGICICTVPVITENVRRIVSEQHTWRAHHRAANTFYICAVFQVSFSCASYVVALDLSSNQLQYPTRRWFQLIAPCCRHAAFIAVPIIAFEVCTWQQLIARFPEISTWTLISQAKALLCAALILWSGRTIFIIAKNIGCIPSQLVVVSALELSASTFLCSAIIEIKRCTRPVQALDRSSVMPSHIARWRFVGIAEGSRITALVSVIVSTKPIFT
jgi:hypothetical protein